MDPKVKVTRTGDGWIVRVGMSWEVVELKSDIRRSIASQLRWFVKLGGDSAMADASRERNYCSGGPTPEGYRRVRWGYGPCRKPRKGE